MHALPGKSLQSGTMMKMRNGILGILLLHFTLVIAQKDSSSSKFTFNGYADIYYSYDFASPPNHEKENFIYNHKRHNQVNANVLLLSAHYVNTNLRANLGFVAGNYQQYNMGHEPGWARYIYEANIGVRLSQKNNLWLDAGIFPSHLGAESPISADCWTLTRSLSAEGSPYYETGLNLNYTSNKNELTLAFWLLNGWQRIKRPDNISKPSFGMQVTYHPNGKLLLNYSNFMGSDQSDSLDAFRFFHDLYLQYTLNNKFDFLAGFDLGTDRYNKNQYGVWYSPNLVIRYSPNDKMRIAIRGEYYHDRNQIIFRTNSMNGFQVSGISANFDYRINKWLQWRLEGKCYDAKDRIFRNNAFKNYSLTTNLTLRF